MRVWRSACFATVLGAVVGISSAKAGEPCPYTCGDVTGNALVELDDYSAFHDCFGVQPAPPECACADLDGDGNVNLFDFALFALIFGSGSDETPPHCTGATATFANLTAHRPQNGTGYAPLTKTPVAEVDEESVTLGPGIRINAPGDTDPAGEDDLIEVLVSIDPPGAAFALRRTHAALRVWTTRNKQAGTEIDFIDDRTGALPIGPGVTQLTIWVEWALAEHGSADMHIEPLALEIVKDSLTFHTFTSIVIVLGGESQVPSYPVDPNHGTFLVGAGLYSLGYDALLYDEDVVAADGSGAAYNAVENAILNRLVSHVAIFGYSHGGGSTYDLAERLDVRRPLLGVFSIDYTSYCDSVSNNSDVDTAQETRRPPATAYHLNHYQRGAFFEDLGLDGGPVPNSNPPPSGLDVETTPWGAGATHFEVDDFLEVRGAIETTLGTQIAR